MKGGGVTRERSDITRAREGEGGVAIHGGALSRDGGARRERYLLMKRVMEETGASV